MTRNLRSRVTSLESIFGVTEAGADVAKSPEIIRVKVAAEFAAEVLGHSQVSQADCLAKLHGLRGSGSLRPWLREGISDVAELARRDYEHDHGEAWRDEWQRQIADVGVILEGRIGVDWQAVLSERITAAIAAA